MQTLALDEITVDLNIQARCKLDEDTVSDYVEAMERGDVLPPVVVYDDGKKKWLASGFHRFEAARRAGRNEIAVEAHSGGRKAALWCSAGANRTNGLRLTLGDKVRAIKLALEVHPDLSDRSIAEHVGCSHTTVSRHRTKPDPGGQVGHLAAGTSKKRVGADGKLYAPNRPAPKRVSDDSPSTCDDPPPAVDDLPPSLDEQPRDRVGQPIKRPEVVTIFRRDHELVALSRQVKQIRTALLRMIEQGDPLTAAMVGTAIEVEGNNFKRLIEAGRPYAVCPHCSGNPSCPACKGRGWLTQDQWRASGKGGNVVPVA